jgi:hypothetical protein
MLSAMSYAKTNLQEKMLFGLRTILHEGITVSINLAVGA